MNQRPDREHIGFLISVTDRLIKRTLSSTLGEGNFSGIQIRIIHFLMRRRKNGTPVYQKNIEKEFKIRRSSVTSVLSNLEKAGYISRSSVDGDARLKQVNVTDKLVSMMEEGREKVEDFEARLSEGISEEEVAAFVRVICKVTENIEKMEEKE